MRRISLWMLLVGVSGLTGCGQTPADQAVSTPAGQAASAPGPSRTCSGAGRRLAGTGLCQSQAVAMLRFDEGDQPPPPEGCDWTIGEVAMPGGAYLLYRTARCGDKITSLTYTPGAPLAHLTYGVSALGGEMSKGQSVAGVIAADRRNPQASILASVRAQIDDPTEKARCHVRKADIPGWPVDAIVVDIPADETARLPQNELRAACGPLGLNQDSQLYWRTGQGIAWHFDLGQEQPDIDPGSLTLVHRRADGQWRPVG